MWQCSSYAGMMELVDMRDFGDVTLVKGFAPSSPRTFFGKSRLACFYKRGSSVTLRLGFLTESKSEDNKKRQIFCRSYLRPWWNWQTRWI